MQSLGEKWALSKDFNFTSNEDTADSCEAVTKETVIDCFRKADIQQAAIADSNYPFKEFQKI